MGQKRKPKDRRVQVTSKRETKRDRGLTFDSKQATANGPCVQPSEARDTINCRNTAHSDPSALGACGLVRFQNNGTEGSSAETMM